MIDDISKHCSPTASIFSRSYFQIAFVIEIEICFRNDITLNTFCLIFLSRELMTNHEMFYSSLSVCVKEDNSRIIAADGPVNNMSHMKTEEHQTYCYDTARSRV